MNTERARDPGGIEGIENYFLPNFCNVRLVFAVVVIAELLAFVITLLAALYPALLAARMEPVEALHGGKLA